MKRNKSKYETYTVRLEDKLMKTQEQKEKHFEKGYSVLDKVKGKAEDVHKARSAVS